MIDNALAWWEMGICPIPLHPRSKRPKIQWKSYQDKMPDENLVRYWFHRPCNIGVMCSNGLTVIDFDQKWRYAMWLQNNAGRGGTFTVTTSRGIHVYFRTNANRGGKTLAFDGGELKMSGYVVTAPSEHPDGPIYQVRSSRPIVRIDDWRELGIDAREPHTPVSAGPKTSQGTIIAKIKSSIDICEWLEQITQVFYAAREIMALCPFHDDRNPSMQIYPFENTAYCYSPQCRAHRKVDVINLVAWRWGMSNGEAISALAREID